MLGAIVRGTAILLGAVVLYLLLWPVPVKSVAWQAPADRGHVEPYSDANRLRAAKLLPLGEHEGPEDVALGADGKLYISTADGRILRMNQDGSNVEIFAETGGRPLGLEFDADNNLLVANAYLGVQRIDPDGRVELLFDSIGDSKLVYTDDIAIAADGRIFVSDATTRFAPGEHGGTYAASVLDLIEHGDSGRIIEFDPDTRSTRLFADGLSFANGVAVSSDQAYLLVVETGAYRIWRYPLAANGATRELVVDNLPDFPDNLNNGLQGRIWVGLISPRDPLLDQLTGWPLLRNMILRLPDAMRPGARPHSHVIAITVAGDVLMDLQGDTGAPPSLTGVLETRSALYLTSLFGQHLGRLDKVDLAPR